MWAAFILGLVLGANLGILMLAMCRLAKDEDDREAAAVLSSGELRLVK